MFGRKWVTCWQYLVLISVLRWVGAPQVMGNTLTTPFNPETIQVAGLYFAVFSCDPARGPGNGSGREWCTQGNYAIQDSSGMCLLMPQRHLPEWREADERAYLHHCIWKSNKGLDNTMPAVVNCMYEVTIKWWTTPWKALWPTQLDVIAWFSPELPQCTNARLCSSLYAGRCHLGIKWHMPLFSWVTWFPCVVFSWGRYFVVVRRWILILVKWYTLIYTNEQQIKVMIANLQCTSNANIKQSWHWSGQCRVHWASNGWRKFHQDILQSGLKIKIWWCCPGSGC